MELQEIVQRMVADGIERLILSSPKSKNFPYRKMTVRPLLIQNRKMYQLERFSQKQAFHENIETEKVAEDIIKSLQEEFSQLDGDTQTATHLIKVSKKGKVLYKTRPCSKCALQLQGQNRKKQYVLDAALAPAPLVDLGVVTADGKIVSARYDKFKQINRFVELIGESIGPNTKSLTMIDFGCGKSYLTFVLYYYLTEVRSIDAKVVGLDLKEEVIANCNQIAQRYGYQNLRFEVGNIDGYHPDFQVDMVISLHACDTATDFALYNAVQWKTPRIFSVPCCQHELGGQMNRKSAGTLTQHGLLKERFAALLTDAVRADMLTAQGYHVDLLEFVDMEHSPKNLLIRAVKKTTASSAPGGTLSRTAQVEAKKRVEEAMAAYGVQPTLYQLLYEGKQQDDAH